MYIYIYICSLFVFFVFTESDTSGAANHPAGGNISKGKKGEISRGGNTQNGIHYFIPEGNLPPP